MKPLFSELVEINELQFLCEIFSKLTGFATAILDMEGNVLTATSWREICTEFHRKYPATAEACHESDTALGKLPPPGAKYNIYRCKNGLIDVSVPIMVENLQVGKLFTGQFLFDSPDIEFFRRQAAEYCFDETSYLEAVQKVPIVSEEQLDQVMEFLCRLAEMIGRMGLGNQRLREANEELLVHRQKLERRVEKRTAELSAKNEQLRKEIDERKHAEETLLEAEQKLRALVDNIPDCIVRFDAECRHLFVNPAVTKIFGAPPDYFVGKTLREIGKPGHYTLNKQLERMINRAFEEGAANRMEAQWVTSEGVRFFDVLHVPERDLSGKVVSVMRIAHDISERKWAEEALRESEEKFRVLAETSPTAIFLYQGEMIIYANPATERLFGYTADALLRMRFWDWAHEDFREMVRTSGLARLRGEAVPSRYESSFVTKDGKDRWLVVSAGLIEYHGRPAGIASFLDITESKRVERQLRESLAEKELLLKEIHHRVKNNLQIISTLLELQAETIHDDILQKSLKDCQDRVRAMALIHEKLYQSSDLACIDFWEYIESLVGHLLSSYVDDPLRIVMKVDVEDIQMGIDRAVPCGLIINELVSNAMKHAFPDGRSGEITIRLRADDRGGITLTVADDGVGLPLGLDFRNTETLGLQLVNLLAKQLKGEITFLNKGGASFTIRFKS